MKIILIAAWLLLAATSRPATALTVAGIDFPPQASVAAKTLVLNGAGVRYKFVIKVYAAGLYLAGKAGTTDDVLNLAGPKRLHIVMLRDINGNELGRLFTRGMEDNSPRDEFSKSIPGTLRLAEMFAVKKQLKTGENFSVEWIPDVGTQVVVNGQPQGAPIKEPEFFKAMLRIWLGPSPADHQLKDLLLGKGPNAGTTPGN